MRNLDALLKRLKERDFTKMRAEVDALSPWLNEVAGKRIDTSKKTVQLVGFKEAAKAYADKRRSLLSSKLEQKGRPICGGCKLQFPLSKVELLLLYKWTKGGAYSQCVLNNYCLGCAAQMRRESGSVKGQYCYPVRKVAKASLEIKRFDYWDEFPILIGDQIKDLSGGAIVADLSHVDFFNLALSAGLSVPPAITYKTPDEGFPWVFINTPKLESNKCVGVIEESYSLE